jgi:ATP-dependent DNA ligase
MRLLKEKYPATAIVFDMLEFNGQNLRNEEYSKRKQQLKEAFNGLPFDIEGRNEPIKVAKDMVPIDAWELAQLHQLEGIVEKRIHSKYTEKRSEDWTKIKRKESFILRFDRYDTSPVGITLENSDGFRVACNGEKHKKVKEKIDLQGFIMVKVRGMAGRTEKGKIREIVFLEEA